MSPRALVPLMLVICWLQAEPLAAQRASQSVLGTAPVPACVMSPRASLPGVPRADDGQAIPDWERHALYGAAIGAFGGWLLSGLPCENAPSACPSTLSSIGAGGLIGALIGALWH